MRRAPAHVFYADDESLSGFSSFDRSISTRRSLRQTWSTSPHVAGRCATTDGRRVGLSQTWRGLTPGEVRSVPACRRGRGFPVEEGRQGHPWRCSGMQGPVGGSDRSRSRPRHGPRRRRCCPITTPQWGGQPAPLNLPARCVHLWLRPRRGLPARAQVGFEAGLGPRADGGGAVAVGGTADAGRRARMGICRKPIHAGSGLWRAVIGWSGPQGEPGGRKTSGPVGAKRRTRLPATGDAHRWRPA